MKTLDLMRWSALPLATASAAVLVACGPQDGGALNADRPAERTTTAGAAADLAAPAPAPAPVAVRQVPQGEAGTVTAVVPLRTAEPATGAGAVIGGVVGGALGSALGKGDGRKAATVLGAVGGAVAGHQVEKDRSTRITGYRVEVRLDDGRKTSVTLAQPVDLAAGQRVRLVDGHLLPA